MLTMPRWEGEVRVMKNVFPEFEPFTVPGEWAGFHGWFLGKRTGTLYQVTIRAKISGYPNKEPAVYMEPRPEPHHWIGFDARLCYQRNGHVWRPAEDTFAQCLAVAARYVEEFDGRG